jgi:hypothetical protein
VLTASCCGTVSSLSCNNSVIPSTPTQGTRVVMVVTVMVMVTAMDKYVKICGVMLRYRPFLGLRISCDMCSKSVIRV